MQIDKVTLIGAGGTGSMVLPAIVPVVDVDIWDGDEYEERNVSRQIYAANVVGNNKADVLAELFGDGHKKVVSYPKMVRGNEDIDSDLIFCCVDNNAGRKAARALSDDHDIPLIICGNESWEPMAWLYLPEYRYTNKDPFDRWQLDKLAEGRQETCQGVEIIEENVQMPAANYCAGSHGLHIWESLRICSNPSNYLAEVVSTPWPIWKQFKQIEA